MRVVALKCINCGSSLEVGPDVENFACGYCGTTYSVERKGGIVALRRFESAVQSVQFNTERTASELAIQRLRGEIAEIEARRDKAVAAIREQDEKSNAVLGWMVIGGLVLAGILISAMGWWSAPLIVGGVYVVWKSIEPASEKIRRCQCVFEAELTPLREQMARHRAAVDEPVRVPA
jgi:hypothetical protein